MTPTYWLIIYGMMVCLNGLGVIYAKHWPVKFLNFLACCGMVIMITIIGLNG